MTKFLITALSLFILGIFGILIMPSSSAVIPQAHAQSCTVPAQVQNVLVDYPQCTGDVCDFTQASCSWDAISDATSYNLTVTQVETGQTVTTQTIAAGTLTHNFAVTQNYTYRCDVAAVNSCGTGVAGTHSLLCAADALIDTPTATPIPVTVVPKPTIPAAGPGAAFPLIAGAASLLISGAGIALFLKK